MKDFPVFTTRFGVASLVLKQIPYSSKAYITIQSSADPQKLLEECVDFCKVAGAQAVFASGHSYLNRYPLHTSILVMRCQREILAETDAAVFPVQEKTLEQFQRIYNEAMQGVANAAYMSNEDAKQVLLKGNAYFVHRGSRLLGVGIASGERIDAIVSVVPGAGKDVLLALNHTLSGSCVEVEVASTNVRAIHLYEKLGFVLCCELSRWYKII